MFKQIKQIWKTQKKPIVFFGFILLVILLAQYNNYSTLLDARSWSKKVLQISNSIETKSANIIKLSNTANQSIEQRQSELNQIKSLRSEINQEIKNNDSIGDEIKSKTFTLKSVFKSYLERLDANWQNSQTNYEKYLELNPKFIVGNPEYLDKLEQFANNQKDTNLQGKILDYVKTAKISIINNKLSPDIKVYDLYLVNRNTIFDASINDYKTSIAEVIQEINKKS
jgi:hypothetical protein